MLGGRRMVRRGKVRNSAVICGLSERSQLLAILLNITVRARTKELVTGLQDGWGLERLSLKHCA